MSKKKIKKAIIPAAGLGTRFLPATKAAPKEMLPLFDKPLIQYVVEEAVSAGIEQIIIITGRGKRAIEDHFDLSFELETILTERKQHDLLDELRKITDMAHFCYVRQNEAKGLGDAVLCAKHLVGDEPVAVLLADEVVHHSTPALKQMIQAYQKNAAPLIGVQKVKQEAVSRYGILDATPTKSAEVYKIKGLVEKPAPHEAPSNLAVIGRYLLHPEIFDFLGKARPGKNGEIQLTDALNRMAQGTPMFGYLIAGERFDAGDKLGLLKASIAMALQNRETEKELKAYLEEITTSCLPA